MRRFPQTGMARFLIHRVRRWSLAGLIGSFTAVAAAQPYQPVSLLVSEMAGESAEPVMLDRLAPLGDNVRHETVFTSRAALVPPDTNGVKDIYLRTSDSGPLGPYRLISVGVSATISNGNSEEPSSTPDGNNIVFRSAATNLVSGDTNGVDDIFLRRPLADVTERVSIASDGSQANGPSYRPQISADGRYVAFVSDASNLVPGDTNGGSDVFVRDLLGNSTLRVSVRSDGSQAAASGSNVRVSISADGRFIAFSSEASDLVADDFNTASDIFLHDLVSGETSRVSLNTIGADPNGPSFNPVLSADGRFVAFDSLASNLVLSDGNGVSDVFLRRLGARRTERVSVSSLGLQANGASIRPSISANGRFVAFSSQATNLDGADTNNQSDIFLRDRASGTTRSRVQGNGASTEASVSPDGRSLAFTTLATNLGVPDSNGTTDVWRALGPPEAVLEILNPLPGAPGTGEVLRVPVRVEDPTGTGPVPRGGVEVRLSDGTGCTVRLLDSSGQGACDLLTGEPGRVVIDARFLGDERYAEARASTEIDVFPTSSILRTVVHAPEPSLAGQGIYVQADLQPAGGRPGGSIQFTAGSASCQAFLPQSGCLLAAPFASDFSINAEYSGGNGFIGATAPTILHEVQGSSRTRIARATSGDGRGFGGEADFGPGSFSRDGRYYVFASRQPYLVPEDGDSTSDVFLLDRRLNLLRRLSVPVGGGVANDANVQPVISGNRRYVAFVTYASNLFPGDTNGRGDVVVVDVQNGNLEVVSVSTAGLLADDTSLRPAISDDGKLVVFHSRASNLVAEDTNSRFDIFLRDRVAQTTTRVSIRSDGGEGFGGLVGAFGAQISADGRYVAYQSSFTNLVSGDTNGNDDIFRFDRLTGQVVRVSVASSGLQLPNGANGVSMSAEGDRIVFQSRSALDDDPDDTNNLNDVFLHELSSGVTRRVSTNDSGIAGDGNSSEGVISPDGNWIAFTTLARNLAGCCSDRTQILKRPVDLAQSGLQLVTLRPKDSAPSDFTNEFPTITDEGLLVGFVARGTDLDPTAPFGGHLIRDKSQSRAVQRGPIGLQPDGNVFAPAIAASGRQLAFISEASNLGPSNNGFAQAYHVDLDSDTLTLVSENSGMPGSGSVVGQTAISADGRIVAFTSFADDLVAGDGNKAADVFLRDLLASSVERVSLDDLNNPSPQGGYLADLSADGRYVLFLSESALASVAPERGYPIGAMQLYLRDRQSGSTVLMSPGVGGGYANADVFAAVGPSSDGCRVAFLSVASNLVPGVSDGLSHVYHYDRCTDQMRLVDQAGKNVSDGYAFEVAMDAAGQRVAFSTDASNLGGPQNFSTKLYLADLKAGTLSEQGLDENGLTPFTGLGGGLDLSPDGNSLVFASSISGRGTERMAPIRSHAEALSRLRRPAPDGPGGQVLYVRDLQAGVSAVVESPGGFLGEPVISANRLAIAYTTADDRLAVGDQNGLDDILLVPNPLPLGGPNTCTREGNGAWNDSSSWSCVPFSGAIPGPGDTAIFDSADDRATLTADVTVAWLDLREGVIDGGADVTVTDRFDWTGGTLDAASLSQRLLLGPDAISTLGGGSKTLRQRQLINQGTLSWTAGTLTLAGESTELRNDAQFIVDVASGTLQLASDGAPGQYFHHTFGTGRSVIKRGAGRYQMDDRIEFRNGNSVRVETGTASFTGPGSGDPGPYQVDNGGILEFNLRSGQTRSIDGTISGAGSLLKLGAGDVLLQGTFSAEGAAVQDGQLLFQQSGTISLTHLLVSDNGTLGGNASLQAQRLNWQGGFISGSAGGTLRLLGSGVNASDLSGVAKCLEQRELIFAGGARWTSGEFCLRNGARVTVESGAALDIDLGTTTGLKNDDGSSVELRVQGVLRKTGAVLDSDVRTVIDGSLQINGGSLTQRETLEGTGLANIASGARLQFATAGLISAALPFSGSGELVTLSGTTRFERPITGGTLSLGVQGNSVAQVDSPMALAGFGVSDGTLQLYQNLSTAGSSFYGGGLIEVYSGTLSIGGPLSVGGVDLRRFDCISGCVGSTLRVLGGGELLVSGSSGAELSGGLPLVMDQAGASVSITAGTRLGLTSPSGDQLLAGSLIVDGLLEHSGTLVLGNGSALAVAGNGTLHANTAIALNATVDPGRAGVVGTLTLDGPSTVVGGLLRMDALNPGSHDRIVMSGTASLVLNPAAQLQPVGPVPSATDVFPLIQHAVGARTGSLTLSGGASGFVLEYAPTAVEYRQPVGARVCRFAASIGNWDDPMNWSCIPAGGFPGEPDTAIVDNGGEVDQNGPRSVSGLELVSGTIRSIDDTLVINESFRWDGGRFVGGTGSSDSVFVADTATTVTLGGGQKNLVGRTLALDADASWTTGLIELSEAAQINVFPGRTLTTEPGIMPTEAIIGGTGGGAVLNLGRILKRGPGTAGIETTVSYGGLGAIEVEAGEFYLHGPSNAIGGEMKVAAGATLVFARSAQQFTSTARYTGAGRLVFGRPDGIPMGVAGDTRGLHSTVAENFTLEPDAVVEVQNSALIISGGVALDRLVLNHPAAELAGDNDIEIRLNLQWRAGVVSGFNSSQAFRVADSAVATLTSSGTKQILGRTLVLDGLLSANGGPLQLEDLAEWQINPGGRFQTAAAGVFQVQCLGYCASPVLINNGQIERSGTGETRLAVATLNDGIIDIRPGARLEVGDFQTDGSSAIRIDGQLTSSSTLRISGGVVDGTGLIVAESVENAGARFAPGGDSAGPLTVQSSYTQSPDGALELRLQGAGCTAASRLVITGTANLGGALDILPENDCSPTAPQQFLLVDATTLTGTFGFVSGVPAGYALDYRNSAGDLVLLPVLQASLTTITAIDPQPTPAGQPYTVTVNVGPVPNTGLPATGTVTVAAAAPFASESCTITLPSTSCTMPAATQPGIRVISASYSGDANYLPSSTSTNHPVRATPTVTALGQTPARTVVGEPFTVRLRVSNPLSTLTPTGNVRVRPLPLGEAVECTLAETAPGEAEASCEGAISPIAAAKLIDIRYLGAENETFGAASTSSVQEVDPANTSLSFISAPNPSSPGAPVQVDFTLTAALPSLSPLSAISGLLIVSDGVDSCTATLPSTRCTLTLSTLGTRQLRARYQGDANFNPSAEVVREHQVVDGGAELVIRKRNLLRTLPGGEPVVYVIEVENRGPLAVTALVRDPIPEGLSNFRWTCSGEGGAVCLASGTGALNENVTLPVNSLARFVLTADVQRDPEVTVIQEARVDPPTGVVDPNPANNVARDIDPIGLFGDGFEENEQE